MFAVVYKTLIGIRGGLNGYNLITLIDVSESPFADVGTDIEIHIIFPYKKKIRIILFLCNE